MFKKGEFQMSYWNTFSLRRYHLLLINQFDGFQPKQTFQQNYIHLFIMVKFFKHLDSRKWSSKTYLGKYFLTLPK